MSEEQRQAALAAKENYMDCLHDNVASVDDGHTDPSNAGITLAGLCLGEFSRYRDIAGLDDDDNDHLATSVVVHHRRH